MTINTAFKAIWYEVDGTLGSEMFLRRDSAEHAISINGRQGEVTEIDYRSKAND